MAIVMDTLFALALIVFAAWLASLVSSARGDKRAADWKAQADAERAHLLARERQLETPGLALACLSCGARFAGPLDASGCPQCHVGAFVVPEEEVNHVHR